MKTLLKNVYDTVVNGKSFEYAVDNSLSKSAFVNKESTVLVFLSITDTNSRALVIKGQGNDLKAAIDSIIKVYNEKKPTEFVPYGIKLDIVDELNKSKSNFNIKKDIVTFKQNLEGIALDINLDTAFLPQEVIAYELVSKAKKKIRPINLLKVLGRRLDYNLLEFAKQLDSQDTLELYKFTVKSFYFDRDNFCELYKGHQLFENVSKEDIWKSIELTKNNYFKNVVDGKGKFLYTYKPNINNVLKGYNILRHAGTTYSMLETYELMPDEKLLSLADKALAYLVKKQKHININNKNFSVIVERDSYKLGGNALAIVAMAKYTQITGDDKYVSNMQSMASWMQEVQDETGRFTVHKQRYSNGKISDFISHFYPGETILALVRLYQVDQNETWLDVAEKAAKYLITERDKNVSLTTVRPDHWLMYALNDLYRERSEGIYLEHSFLMAQAIINKQLTEESTNRIELIGGYQPRPNKTPGLTNNACWSEGLGAAYGLAVDFENKDFALKIKDVIHNGIKFQLQGQLRPENVMYFDNKSLCLGAFHKSLRNYELRNDYTQHNISSLICYYKILNNQ